MLNHTSTNSKKGDTLKFSIYDKPIKNIYPNRELELSEFIELIKSEKYKSICKEARSIKLTGDEKKLREFKAKEFDYITMSGTFSKREAISLKELSGYYAADLDNIKNFEEVKAAIKKDPFVHVLFTSPSGGLKAIIKIPKELDNFEKYVVSFYEYLDKNYEIKGKIDSKTKDVCRACFLSYDPELFYNPNSATWSIKHKEPIKQEETKTLTKELPTYSENTLKAMLKHVPCRNWGEHTFYVMMALIHYSEYRNKDYFGLFRWWVHTYDGSITVEDMKTKWEQYKQKKTDKPVTIRSLVKEAFEHGYTFPEPKKEINMCGLRVDNYFQNVQEFYKQQPFFLDDSKIFWFWDWDKCCYEIINDIDLMVLLEKVLDFNGQTIFSTVKYNYLEAFRRVGRTNKPKDAPLKWVQFKDKAYSLSSGKTYEVTPDYFFTNPINWDLGDAPETPTMDKLFAEWVGKDNVRALYDIIAYCCYRSYPIQLIFAFCGSGRNGKSQFFKVVEKFLGNHNICSTELDTLMDNRFESFKLYKKLCCQLGETDFGILKKSSLLKKLVGGDMIGFEKKTKDPFDAHNYAKIMINSNSLPTSNDQSDGFYRRWNIIEFPNEFEESNGEVYLQIPDKEYNNLARKVAQILVVILKNNSIHNQGTIRERTDKFLFHSNPIKQFLDKCCIVDISDTEMFEKYGAVYTSYVQFLIKNKKRRVKHTEFKQVLSEEGLFVERTSKEVEGKFVSSNWISGIKLKKDWKNKIKIV
jgi:P4 family phage/plasmid primase-like protien